MINRIVRTLVAAAVALTSLLPTVAQAANERELYLYYTHTRETVRIVYKRDGRFVQSALNELNVFLRDWRRNEPAQMDPALYDILWEIYQQSGASQPIHIVSAYRSPQTNAMLRSNSSGVADNSQHTKGKAVDFYIPGVAISTLRALGMRMQVGGVGYYPSSGSPFVHVDTGSVRAWPRMTEAQLRELFPDGRTLHLPSNGRVLSQEGYQFAQAEWQRCSRVPCNAGAAIGGGTMVADGERPRTLWDMFTGGGNNNQQQAAPQPQAQPTTQVAAAPAPQPTPAAPIAAPAAPAAAPTQQANAQAPVPPARPSDMMVADATPQNIPFQVIDAEEMTRQVAMADAGGALEAPLPPSMSNALAELRETNPSAYAPAGGGTLSVAAIQEAPVPQPRPDFPPAVAAIEEQTATPAAELEMRPGFDTAIETASLGGNTDLEAFASLFDGAVMPGEADGATRNALASLSVEDGALFSPHLESVAETLTTTASLSSSHFFFGGEGASETDTQPMVASSGFTRTADMGQSSSDFGPGQTIWVHYDSQTN